MGLAFLPAAALPLSLGAAVHLSPARRRRRPQAAVSCRAASGTPNGGGGAPRTPSPAGNGAAVSVTSADVDVARLSPMMRHWVETKRARPHYLLLYRVGDFFETFFEDAATFAAVCGVALTSKDGGKALGGRVPMSGVPHYTLDDKCRELLAAALNVAVVDQVEPAGGGAGLVRRAVTRLITPGTLLDDRLLDTTRDNFLACVSVTSARAAELHFGLALADVCTGELRATDAVGLPALERLLRAAEPREVLLPAFGGVRVDPDEEEDEAEDEDGEVRVAEGDAEWVRGTSAAEKMRALVQTLRRAGVQVVTMRPARDFGEDACNEVVCGRFDVDNVECLGCRQRGAIVSAVGALLTFVGETVEVDGRGSVPFSRPGIFAPGDNMEMDSTAVRNLEVVETLRDGPAGKSLRWAVDRTVTAMGARRVRAWLLAPLRRRDDILYRQRIVGGLVRDRRRLDELQAVLRSVADLERLAGRVGGERASPRDVQRLAHSLLQLPDVADLLMFAGEPVPDAAPASEEAADGGAQDGAGNRGPFARILSALGVDETMQDGGMSDFERMVHVAQTVQDALVDPAPSLLLSARLPAPLAAFGDTEASAYDIFCEGYDEELDVLRASRCNPNSWMALVEKEEQSRTGIASLRVKKLRNTGYVLRVARSVAERKLAETPGFFSVLGYERALSTKTEMRFKSTALAEREKDENAVARALLNMELEMFQQLLDRLIQLTDKIRKAAAGLAELDALCGFAQVSSEQGYAAPEIVTDEDSRLLYIEDGRHPVVEQNLPAGKSFVPNSFCMGSDVDVAELAPEASSAEEPESRSDMGTIHRAFPPHCDEMILCGPNASGKSCAMRMVGLIVILAQAGCFVPANRMTLGVVDRIFTRVGAVDDMSLGQSTFQVEMAETASILCQATRKSLVLLDEIGRGTAVADGVAIAWAVAEHMAGVHEPGEVEGHGRKHRIPRTMFVTHYHELNELVHLPNVEAFRMQAVSSVPDVANVETASAGDVVYTHRVLPGASWDSHGLAIARRAGFPIEVIARADSILQLLQEPSAGLASRIRSSLSLVDGSDGGLPRDDAVESGIDSSSGPDCSEAFCEGFEEGRQSALREVQKHVISLLDVPGSPDS